MPFPFKRIAAVKSFRFHFADNLPYRDITVSRKAKRTLPISDKRTVPYVKVLYANVLYVNVLYIRADKIIKFRKIIAVMRVAVGNIPDNAKVLNVGKSRKNGSESFFPVKIARALGRKRVLYGRD